MKLRADILRVYKDVHTWTGILCSLALFIAFYAGAITMFETPLQRWASPPATLAPPPPLHQAQQLVDAVLERHPEAAGRYRVVVETSPEDPARLSWQVRPPGAGRGAEAVQYAASFDAQGALQVVQHRPAEVAQLVDMLHQQVGLPFDHEVAMPIMGVIALLYALALVSGVIILLPTFMQDLFATRLGAALKRRWLDVHNVLGVFSLPFHLIMALTAVVFALHDPIYATQDAVSYEGRLDELFVVGAASPRQPAAGTRPLTPQQIVARMQQQEPGFKVQAIEYLAQGGQPEIRVAGTSSGHGHRAPTFGYAGVDAYSGDIVSTDYLPGRQDGWYATVTGFFALHFGNFGGTPVRWGYFLLGLAGAFLFYSGNLLWIESRRRSARRGEPVVQKRSTQVMANLTVGVAMGSMAGISLTIAAAKWLPPHHADAGAWHAGIHYAVLLAALGWAFMRGAAQAAWELLALCAVATLLIPLTSLLVAAGWLPGWNHPGAAMLVDVVAGCGGALFAVLAQRSRRRWLAGRRDSVWGKAGTTETDAGPVGLPQPDSR